MTKFNLILFFALFFATSAVSIAANGYVCSQEAVTGFAMEQNRQWRQKNFKPDKKYNVSRLTANDKSPLTDGPPHEWIVKELGVEDGVSFCPAIVEGILFCSGAGLNMIVNTEALRFQEYFEYGYVYASAGDVHFVPLTPYIAIGKCSRY
jgi:hypothetical protein